MTEGITNTPYPQQMPTPNPDLKSLDRLVGTWKQSGGVEGEVTYEWMEGAFFLIQRVDLDHDGHPIKGVEIIGHLQAFGEEPSKDIKLLQGQIERRRQHPNRGMGISRRWWI